MFKFVIVEYTYSLDSTALVCVLFKLLTRKRAEIVRPIYCESEINCTNIT